jgi:hypothetical protein
MIIVIIIVIIIIQPIHRVCKPGSPADEAAWLVGRKTLVESLVALCGRLIKDKYRRSYYKMFHRPEALVGAGVLMGTGVVIMHYAGMVSSFALSLSLCLSLSFFSRLVYLCKMFHRPKALVGAGVLMGTGVVIMHYCGMVSPRSLFLLPLSVSLSLCIFLSV